MTSLKKYGNKRKYKKRAPDSISFERTKKYYQKWKNEDNITSLALLQNHIQISLNILNRRLRDQPKHEKWLRKKALWEERMSEVKQARQKKTDKARTKSYFGKRAVNDYGFSHRELWQTVESLRAGNSSPIFTILNSEKAPKNHAVHVVVNLDNGETLCIYKRALEALEKSE